MKHLAITLTLLLALLAVPLAAQDRTVDLTLWASRTNVQGSDTINGSFETDYDSGDGFGISTNYFMTKRFSVEVAAFKVSSDATLMFGNIPFSMGSAGMTPVMAGLQFHPLGASRFDPYVGAGAAYVLGGKLESTDLTNLGAGTIELGNELNWYANAGVGVGIFRGIGLVLDGRYIPYQPSTKASGTGGEQDLDLTTMMVSAGLRFRF